MKMMIVLAASVFAFTGSAFAAQTGATATPVKTTTTAPNSGAPNYGGPVTPLDQTGCPYAPGTGVGSGTMYGCNHP